MFVNESRALRKGEWIGVVAAGFLFCFICSLSAKQVGKFSYLGAPEDFNSPKFSDTVTVSDTIVAMAEKVYVKNFTYSSSIVDTPAIFFVIDHSTSMSHDGSMNDPLGNRFTVTSAFIDTIAKRFPTADIGIGIFKQMLHLRAGDKPYFAPQPMPYDPAGAYIPLLKLNGTTGGQTGIAILKDILTTKTAHDPDDNVDYAELVYTPSTWPLEGTNINVGFEAAKTAFSKSPRPKNNHYIIFLSDGDANDNLSQNEYEFEAGKNVPTTYTIYFTKGTTVPASIRRMTQNIRVNGYSTSNSKSNYWAFNNTNFSSLMNFLMTNVLDSLYEEQPVLPTEMIVSGQTVNAWVDSAFTFNSLFPLTGRVTPFNFKITYKCNTKWDSTHVVDFNVKTQAGFVMPSTDFEVKLWDRDIGFSYNGAPISVATETMDPIGISFPWSGGTANYRYTNVTIDLYTVVPPVDHETVMLNPGAGVFNGNFRRATNVVKTPANGILEHTLSGDTIIAVFRNSEAPKLPLDTLRVVLPLKITPLAVLYSAITRDFDGDGYLDHIELLFNRKIAIASDAGSSFIVQLAAINFPVDSVTKLSDSSYSLCLHQHAIPLPLETSWKPTVSIPGLTGVDTVYNFFTADGAAPVVFTAVKKIVSFDDRTTDTVTVTLSEKITGKDGNSFSTANMPGASFYIWIKDVATFIRVDSMLAGIPGFVRMPDDSTLIFTMSNRRNLDTSHWINILTPEPLLCDKPSNFPTDKNRKVRIQIIDAIPPSGLDSAVTRDVSGNGYLDHIVLYFDRYTDLFSSGVSPSSFTIEQASHNVTFPVEAVTILPNSTRSYLLRLTEQQSTPLQTSWRPTVTIAALPKVATVIKLRAYDGAPPVIATAAKKIQDIDNKLKDTVTIVMSERITTKTGVPFSIINRPDRTFFSWLRPNNVFVRDSVLDGIVNFTKVKDDSILVFSMSNKRDLTNNHWLNIQDLNELLCDYRRNFPTDSNRKVRVMVNDTTPSIVSFPNPSEPTLKHIPADEFWLKHEPDAFEWVFTDNAGVVIAIKGISVPPNGSNVKIKGRLKIYDVIGNPVNWSTTDDLLSGMKLDISTTEVHIYWNGFNKSGMAVGSGVYRVAVYLDYSGYRENVRLLTKVGIINR